MTLTAKVITGTLSATLSGTTDFTSSGFGTPDAAILFCGEGNTSSNPQNHGSMCIGFWDGTNVGGISAYSVDGVAASSSTRTNRHLSSTYPLARYLMDRSGFAYAYSISSITDGIRLTLSVDATGVQRYATVILLKGLVNKAAFSVGLGTGTSAIDVTTPGFKPDFLMVIGDGSGDDFPYTNSCFSCGFANNNASDTVTQGCVVFSSDNAVSSTRVQSIVRNNSVVGQLVADAETYYVTASDFDSSGFSLTPSASAGNDICFVLALEFDLPNDAYVGVVDSHTSTGTKEYSGFSHTPIIAGYVSGANGSVNTLQTSSLMALSIGATDGTTQQSHTYNDRDNQATGSSKGRRDTNVLNLRFDDDTVDAVAAHSSFGTSGWTLNYSDGSASARKMLMWALGNQAATQLQGAGAANVTATGALSTAIQLAGAAAAAALATGGLTAQTLLSGAATAVVSASGGLTTEIKLAGAAQAAGAATGDLTASVTLSGAALSVATASGQITTQIPLAGSAVAVTLANGALTAQITLQGGAIAQATAAGALTTGGAGLEGGAAAVATAGATLTTQITLAGDVFGLATGQATLTTQTVLSGAAIANAIASGSLIAQINLEALAAASAEASGTLTDAAAIVHVQDMRYHIDAEPRAWHVERPARNWRIGRRGERAGDR